MSNTIQNRRARFEQPDWARQDSEDRLNSQSDIHIEGSAMDSQTTEGRLRLESKGATQQEIARFTDEVQIKNIVDTTRIHFTYRELELSR